MKPGKTFKLSKPTKTMLASIVDPKKRSEWKRAMIDAELCAAVVPKREKRPGGPGGYVKNATGTASTTDWSRGIGIAGNTVALQASVGSSILPSSTKISNSRPL